MVVAQMLLMWTAACKKGYGNGLLRRSCVNDCCCCHGTLQEAEEFMKLLGTHQQHGRVFARLGYDDNVVKVRRG